MKLHTHTAFSVAISGILYLIFKSWSMSLSCLVSGIFIDIDHFVDVIREHGWSVKLEEFFDICHRGQFERIFLFWHGWEWTLFLAFASWLTDWNPWITGVCIGILQHLILDTISNASGPWSYSLIWRWQKKFHFDTIFPKFKAVKYKYR